MTKEQKADNLILLILALGGVLLHILLNGQYGFHRDELDVIMNARQLDWGYVAYPPLTPFLAKSALNCLAILYAGCVSSQRLHRELPCSWQDGSLAIWAGSGRPRSYLLSRCSSRQFLSWQAPGLCTSPLIIYGG